MDKEPRIVTFPLFGLDVSQGPFVQRAGTSPLAINVRAYDVGLRRRGGSRPGLTPFFGAGSTEQVNGFNKIQSLSCIVTADQAATFDSQSLIVNFDVHYSESDNPPPRDSPITSNALTWYRNTSPTREYVTEPVVGTPDGGGTGRGTARFKISTDGVDVILDCSFISAGFPGPYVPSGNPIDFTMTQAAATFFNPMIGGMSSNWTVVSGSFIGNYFFNCYYPGP